MKIRITAYMSAIPSVVSATSFRVNGRLERRPFLILLRIDIIFSLFFGLSSIFSLQESLCTWIS